MGYAKLSARPHHYAQDEAFKKDAPCFRYSAAGG